MSDLHLLRKAFSSLSSLSSVLYVAITCASQVTEGTFLFAFVNIAAQNIAHKTKYTIQGRDRIFQALKSHVGLSLLKLHIIFLHI